ncbi:MAG: molybdenum ABC transporter ATP-binding protein [Pseudomonadota bacterium]
MLEIDVKKTLGDFSLNIAVTAPPGVTAIFGPSGSGKTSVVNALAGLMTPDAGYIAVGDKVLFDSGARVDLPTHKRRIGYVFQDARLFPHMNVDDNLKYGGNYEADHLIDLLGLQDLLRRYPGNLSGGEKQRVAIGRALMSDPQIVLMDEPLASLDAQRKAEILPYIERLRDEVKIPILYVSHDVSEVARLATSIAVINNGKIVMSGPLEEVLSQPAAVPVLGVRAAGAVIEARIAGRLLQDGLTELSFSGGRLMMPGNLGQLGQTIRLRIPAQDIILARERPDGLSALNILPVQITALEQGRGPGVAIALQAGKDRLLARVTRRSAERMQLTEGQEIFAIIKATAVGPEDVGG